jgi:hypothetical protein
MKAVAAILTMCLMCVLLGMGCSKEEPPPPPPKKIQKIKIPKPPERLEPEQGKAPIPAEHEMAQARQPERVKAPLVEKIQIKMPESVTEEKALPAQHVGEVKVKVPIEKEKPAEKPVPMPEIPAQEKEAATDEMKGYYIVKKGESLYDVAEREDVYMDPLKWPILYRLNMDTLGDLQTEEDVVEKGLSEGLRLKITPQDEVKENLNKRSGNRWAINVLSTTSNENIIPLTVTLIKNGYSAYLTQATIKGKVWTRLRVGFFNNKTEVDAEKEKIRSILHLSDLWSVRLGPMEFAEFAGY